MEPGSWRMSKTYKRMDRILQDVIMNIMNVFERERD